MSGFGSLWVSGFKGFSRFKGFTEFKAFGVWGALRRQCIAIGA